MQYMPFATRGAHRPFFSHIQKCSKVSNFMDSNGVFLSWMFICKGFGRHTVSTVSQETL